MNFLIFLLFFLYTLTTSKIINILHITDIHYDQLYNEGSPNNCKFGTDVGTLCCHKYNIPLNPFQPAGKFGDFYCDTPLNLIKGTFEWIKNNINIDTIFYGGDSVNHHDFIQSENSNLQIISTITREIKLNFPNITFFPVIGNHDFYPIDQFSSKYHSYMLNQLSKMWNINDPSFRKYGFYVRQFYNIKIIVLNSVIWNIHNIMGNLSDDSEIQYQWLKNEISSLDIEKNIKNSTNPKNPTNSKIWIIGHIPPSSHESVELFSDNYEKIINNKVEYSFWYHTHTDEYFITNNSIGFITPSLVPLEHYSAFRVYQFNTSDSQILNYQNYYMNLTEVNIKGKVEYKLLYDFKERYQMELNRNNFKDLAYNMLKNDTLFKTYCNNYYSGYPLNKCDLKYRKFYICDILYVSYIERSKCKI